MASAQLGGIDGHHPQKADWWLNMRTWKAARPLPVFAVITSPMATTPERQTSS